MACPICGHDAVDHAAACVNRHPSQPQPPRRAPARSKRRSWIERCLYVVLALLISSFFVVAANDIHNSGTGPHGGIYLIHLGEPSTIDLEPLRDYYKQALGLDVTILPPARLDSAAFDSERQQLVAERVIESMRQAVGGSIANDSDAQVLGVVEQDMYIEEYDWAYALNLREDYRFAVISTARITSSPETEPRELLASRWRRRSGPDRRRVRSAAGGVPPRLTKDARRRELSVLHRQPANRVGPPDIHRRPH
jgi:hypothetical protein